MLLFYPPIGAVILSVSAQIRPPNFSLEFMPNTAFSCADKVIGGYYADPEAQCQMFHLCIKVAGEVSTCLDISLVCIIIGYRYLFLKKKRRKITLIFKVPNTKLLSVLTNLELLLYKTSIVGNTLVIVNTLM